MRRSPWNRTLSAIFAVWLALVMGDAGFAHHHCPMHDGPMPSAMSGGEMHGAGHGASHLSHGDDGTQTPDGQHLCTCIGACAGSTGAAVAFATPTELPAARISYVAATAPERGELQAHPHRAAFTLPFANGPPPRIA